MFFPIAITLTYFEKRVLGYSVTFRFHLNIRVSRGNGKRFTIHLLWVYIFNLRLKCRENFLFLFFFQHVCYLRYISCWQSFVLK